MRAAIASRAVSTAAVLVLTATGGATLPTPVSAAAAPAVSAPPAASGEHVPWGGSLTDLRCVAPNGASTHGSGGTARFGFAQREAVACISSTDVLEDPSQAPDTDAGDRRSTLALALALCASGLILFAAARLRRGGLPR